MTAAADQKPKEDDTRAGADVLATLQRMRIQQEAITAASLSDAFVAGDVEQLAREITEIVARATGVERANVWLFNEGETELRCLDLFEATPQRHSSGLVLTEAQYANEFKALKSASYVDADDPLTDPRTSGYVEGYLKPLRITSMLDALVQVSGRRLGLLCLEHVDKAHHWESDEVHFACQFADKIALAILNRARRDAQNTLRASEVRYRRLFESSRDGILILDAATATVVDANPSLLELMGGAREDLLGRRIWELGFLKDIFASEADFAELQRQGYVRYDDLVLEARDGRRIDVEFVSNVYLVNEQRRMQCNLRDISKRARAEAALRASENKYHGLFEATRDAMMTLSPPDWRFTSGNPAAIRMFGAAAEEELVSHNPWEASPERQPDGRPSSEKAMEMIERAMRDGSHSFTWTHRRLGGEEFDADVLLTRVSEGDHAILYATIRDITESKRAEEALEASLREKKALLKEVHHRVKNNLQVITSLLRLEAGRRADPGTRLVLKEMQGRILSMALLHETLYRSGEFGRVDLASYLKQLTEQFLRAQNPGPGVVRVEMDLQPARVGIDQAIPCGLIVNELLTNVLKHGLAPETGGAVRVVVRPEGEGQVYLAVSDNGTGLPPDFEARREKSLGMQLVSDLARQIGGRLEIGPAPLAAFAITFTPTLPHSTGPTLRPSPVAE